MQYTAFSWGPFQKTETGQSRLDQWSKTRRRNVRVRPLRSAPVEVQIIGQDSLNILYARDISTAGIGVYVSHRFVDCDINSEVELVITLPTERSFLARGTIKHTVYGNEVSGYFGIEFTAIDPKNHDRIATYVKGLSQQNDVA